MKYLKISIILLMVIVPILFWFKVKSNEYPNSTLTNDETIDDITELQGDGSIIDDGFDGFVDKTNEYHYSTLMKCETIDDIRELYGDGSVVDDGFVGIGEGQYLEDSKSFIVFKGTKNEFRVNYYPLEGDGTSHVAYIFEQFDSDWTLPCDVRAGMLLSELEDINKAPISFLGFEWDDGGMIRDWHDGEFSRVDGIIYRGELGSMYNNKSTLELRGDEEFNSEMAIVDKLDIFLVRFEIVKLGQRKQLQDGAF